ncbi:hypothetical protein R6Q59_032201 [Mikania micrantha]
MRCKLHFTDLSSIVGVCASCLRERLLSVVAAQMKAQAQNQTIGERNRNSETHPVFPRSVSPYTSRRKTDNSVSITNNKRNSDWNRRHIIPDRRLFSTPQVAHTTGSYNSCRKKKHRFIPLYLLSKLFRSRKRNEDSDRRHSISVSDYPGARGGDDSATSVMSSPFWFSNKRPVGGCQKKQPTCFSETSIASSAGVIRKQYCPDRGMSPVSLSDCSDAEDEFCDGSGGNVTYGSRKQTPAHHSVRRGGHGKNVSGLTFCLTPLVRASPRRRWNQNGVAPVDGGEIRSPVKPYLSNTKAFCANRSRKLADFGRFPTNR